MTFDMVPSCCLTDAPKLMIVISQRYIAYDVPLVALKNLLPKCFLLAIHIHAFPCGLQPGNPMDALSCENVCQCRDSLVF